VISTFLYRRPIQLKWTRNSWHAYRALDRSAMENNDEESNFGSIETFCTVSTALTCMAAICSAVEKPEKPNVLFIISDDLNTSLSGFGHPQCKTPELDKLAARGVKFQNMHCQYPVCGASRASIMSGLYPYTNRTMGNQGTLRGSMPNVLTMSQLFRQNGYYAGRVSKIYHMRITPVFRIWTHRLDGS